MSRAEKKEDGGYNTAGSLARPGGEAPSLESVLGEEAILGTVTPFIYYLETAVAVYDSDGNQIGRVLEGNEYCRFLYSEAGASCTDSGSRATIAAIESGRQQITNCRGGMILGASPVISRGRILGAVVGAVSEVPSEEADLREIAGCCHVDYERLQQTADRSFHKPDYLYEAALQHLDRLAQLLATLYEAALERDQRVREIEALNKVIAASAGSLDPHALYSRASRALQEVTNAMLVVIYTLDREAGVFKLGGSSYEADASMIQHVKRLSFDDPIEGLLVGTGKAAVVFDVNSDDRVTPQRKTIALSQGFTSFVAMPVKSHDEVLGMMMVFADTVDVCSEKNIRFIDTLSDQLGIAMQNSRLYNNMENNSLFMQNLFESMDEGVYTCDLARNFTYVNKAVETVSGYKADELIGRNVDLVIPEDQMEKLREMMARRDAGETDRYEIDIVKKDGTRITINQSVSPLYHDGEVVGIVGVADDVSKRKKLRERLQLQNQRLNLLQSIMNRSVSGLTRGRALKTLVREVAETFGYCLCNIFMPSADGKKLQIVATHGYDAEFLSQLNDGDAFSLTNKDFAKTPVVRAYLKGEQGVLCDVDRDSPDPRLAAAARSYGFRAAAATPLEYKDERLGVFVVYTEDSHDFDDEELGLLSSIANQASVIAGNADVYDRLFKSEERYRELYDKAADWMYTLNINGTVIECNETMTQALGVSKEDVIGKHIYDFEASLDREKAKADLADYMKRAKPGMIFTSERKFVTASGTFMNLEVHSRSMPGESGGTLQWRTVARDITEKKEAEKRINLLAAAVENTHESVIISDLKSTVISANRATAQMLGFDDPSDLVGIHIRDFISGDVPRSMREEINRKTLEGGWEGQVIFVRKDGSSFPAFVSSAAVTDGNGDPIAMVGISRDISVERRMTEEILRRNRELAVLNSVGVAAAASLDLESILEKCLVSVVESSGYDAGIIYLLDSSSASLKPQASHGISSELLEIFGEVKVGEGFAGNIARSSAPLFGDFNKSSPYWVARVDVECHPFVSLGGVPLVSRDQLLGVMMVATTENHEFGEHERHLLMSAGSTIGVAIDNARLFQDVARAKQSWETTFDAMTNGVSIHDRDFTIIRANRALANMLNTSAQELVGRKCYEIFHGLDEPICKCPHQLAIDSGESISLVFEEPYLGRTFNISADPIFDSEGDVIGTVHDVRDITEQEELRDQLNQSEKIRALGEMAGGVAHDFNNFLTVILGNSQLLLSQIESDNGVRDSLESIQRAATDASETVRRIQEFTRVRTTRSFTTVDINDVIRHSIEVTRPRWQNEADAHGVGIDIKTKLGVVPPVNGNESELSEVVINMILNALDALEGGGSIEIESRPVGESVVVSITDTGRGMSDDVQRRVFEPFFSTKGPQGTGLGLSVAYGIINRHGGDIMVESNPGNGTTFTLRLPQGAVADLAEAHEQPEEILAAVSPARILVVDDADMIRMLLEDMLEDMGHAVVTAGSGPEALKLFTEANTGERSEPFDVVLTDLGMPGMSGWDVVEEVKEISPETPVALITGWGDQLDQDRMGQSRVDEVLAKPFRVNDVRRLLARVLAKKD